MTTGFVIIGAPCTGKTRLAISLAAALQERGLPFFVLHADITKVTLRRLGVPELDGSAWSCGVEPRHDRASEELSAQWEKAQRDGYFLVVEGTLAVDFAPTDAVRVLLEVEQEVRVARIGQKHSSASETLRERTNEFDRYARWLADHVGPNAVRLDGSRAISELVGVLIDTLEAPQHR